MARRAIWLSYVRATPGTLPLLSPRSGRRVPAEPLAVPEQTLAALAYGWPGLGGGPKSPPAIRVDRPNPGLAKGKQWAGAAAGRQARGGGRQLARAAGRAGAGRERPPASQNLHFHRQPGPDTVGLWQPAAQAGLPGRPQPGVPAGARPPERGCALLPPPGLVSPGRSEYVLGAVSIIVPRRDGSPDSALSLPPPPRHGRARCVSQRPFCSARSAPAEAAASRAEPAAFWGSESPPPPPPPHASRPQTAPAIPPARTVGGGVRSLSRASLPLRWFLDICRKTTSLSKQPK